MFIQLSVHPVTQLVLIQSSDSFLFFAFSYFLNFFFFLFVIFVLMRGWGGWGGSWTKTRGLRGFSSWIQQAEYDLCPKVNLSQEWDNFSINKHKNLVCWLTGNKKKKKGQDGIWWIPTQWGTKAFRPLFLFCFGFVCFSLETCSYLMGLEVDSCLCSAGFAILISSIIDICNGENIWTVAFFILVTCDAIKWR